MPGFSYLSKDDIELRAEIFDRPVDFQSPSDTPDGQGGSTRTWATTQHTFAHIEPWKGKEPFFAQQMYPNMYVRVLIRYRPSLNITATMRMLYGTRNYNIRSVAVIGEAKKVIELLAEELQAEGSLH